MAAIKPALGSVEPASSCFGSGLTVFSALDAMAAIKPALESFWRLPFCLSSCPSVADALAAIAAMRPARGSPRSVAPVSTLFSSFREAIAARTPARALLIPSSESTPLAAIAAMTPARLLSGLSDPSFFWASTPVKARAATTLLEASFCSLALRFASSFLAFSSALRCFSAAFFLAFSSFSTCI